MTDIERYLQAYNEQLRTDAETPSAVSVTRLGPLRLVTFAGGRGFITYQDLGDADAAAIAALVQDALAHYVVQPEITRVEWKTRGHDRAPGLDEALRSNGFEPDEVESIMIGPLEALAGDIPTPPGVTLRVVTDEADVRAMSAMIDEAFGEDVDPGIANALLARLARNDGMQLWVAETDGRMVSGGRLKPTAAWCRCGRGARAALALGKTLVHSDSTEYSRPILERSGLVKVSTTTPYRWAR
jgi:hypothetical protein